MGILQDIAKNFLPKATGINVPAPGNILDVFAGGIWDWVGRQVTTVEERVAPGGIFSQQTGDIPKILGNIDTGIRAVENLFGGGLRDLGINPPVQNVLQTLTGGGQSMAISVTGCPVPARSMSVPAGSCVTVNDWMAAGQPRGFEVAGVSQGNTLILRKKGRRRSRRPLPPSLVSQFAQLKDQLGPAMAKTIINRMRF